MSCKEAGPKTYRIRLAQRSTEVYVELWRKVAASLFNIDDNAALKKTPGTFLAFQAFLPASRLLPQ